MAEERFWGHVTKGEGDTCWEWSPVFKDGYGNFRYQGRTYGAHRVSWMMDNGPIASGLVVRHKCDNRACVRPDHLEIGTKKDNGHDAVIRGRKPKHYDYWISLRSAAMRLGIKADTLRQQVHRGRLQATMMQGWHVRISEVERYRQESLGRRGRHVTASAVEAYRQQHLGRQGGKR